MKATGTAALWVGCALLAGCGGAAVSPFWRTAIGGDPGRAGLTLLDLKGYQQTTDYTCGPAAVKTLLHYYGRDADEMALAGEMGTTEAVGTTPENLAAWLAAHGFEVAWGEHGTLGLLRENLARGVPTLVEWSDWGGHWVAVVGYDDRGTPDTVEDDVIVFADPSDTHDDRRDGTTWFNAERFDYMWYDALLFGRTWYRVYIAATPAAAAGR